jgi:hypothetical protein
MMKVSCGKLKNFLCTREFLRERSQIISSVENWFRNIVSRSQSSVLEWNRINESPRVIDWGIWAHFRGLFEIQDGVWSIFKHYKETYVQIFSSFCLVKQKLEFSGKITVKKFQTYFTSIMRAYYDNTKNTRALYTRKTIYANLFHFYNARTYWHT